MMSNFRGTEYEVTERSTYGSSGDVYINLKSVDYIATTKLYDEASSVEDNLKRLEQLCEDIEDLGRMIYKQDPAIYFGYYQGVSDLDGQFAFGVNHRIIKHASYKYNHIFTKAKIQRALKINDILDSDKFGDEEENN